MLSGALPNHARGARAFQSWENFILYPKSMSVLELSYIIETTKFIPMVINGKWYTNKIIDERTSLQFLWCCSPSHRHICAVAKLTSCLHPYYIWYIFGGIEHISAHFSRQIAPQGQQKGNFRPNLVSMVLSKTFLMKF